MCRGGIADRSPQSGMIVRESIERRTISVTDVSAPRILEQGSVDARFASFSISRSGFHSRQPLRRCGRYGNPTYKGVVTWTY